MIHKVMNKQGLNKMLKSVPSGLYNAAHTAAIVLRIVVQNGFALAVIVVMRRCFCGSYFYLNPER